MYCEKCGAVIDDNAAFCEKCGVQIQSTYPNSNRPNKSLVDEQPQNEWTIYIGEQAIAYYKVLIISIVVTVILSIAGYVILFSIKNTFDGLIAEIEMKYNGYSSYYQRIENEGVRTLQTFKNIFSLTLPILIICDIVSLVKFFISFITVKNTSLYLTNIGIVGNTGKPFGTSILKARFSDIVCAEAKNCKNEYGWLVIDTKWGTKYTFILGNPSSFLHYLNEERKKNS